MYRLEYTFDTSGPLFNGLAAAQVEAFRREARDDLAAQAYANVALYLNAQIKNPTPYYETQIINELRADDRIVHDRGIVYGPWLEGTSERNRTTRFKGYASFRKAMQRTQAEATALLQRTLQPYLRRMG